MERLALLARERDVSHRHSHARELGPVGDADRGEGRQGACWIWASATSATRACCCAASTTRPSSCWTCASRCSMTAKIMPYYFYMCDMIPNAEHWRLSLAEAQQLQHDIMGYLPGFATPRFICDVPYVGKRWVHQVSRYDRRTRASRTGRRTTGPAWSWTTRSRWSASTSTTTRSTCSRGRPEVLARARGRDRSQLSLAVRGRGGDAGGTRETCRPHPRLVGSQLSHSSWLRDCTWARIPARASSGRTLLSWRPSRRRRETSAVAASAGPITAR